MISMKKNECVNYCLVPSLDSEDIIAVRICEGTYTGSVFTIKKVTLAENGLVTCEIEYDLIVIFGVVSDKPDLEIMNRDAIDGIVEELVTDSLKSYKKGE